MCFGGILIFLGETLRLTSIRYAGGTTRTRLVGAPSLCSDGPYSYVRNPLYIANIVIYIGIVIFSGGPAKGKNELMTEVMDIVKGGGFGSIVGRNAFQRPFNEGISLMKEIMDIYKNSYNEARPEDWL